MGAQNLSPTLKGRTGEAGREGSNGKETLNTEFSRTRKSLLGEVEVYKQETRLGNVYIA